MFTFRKLIFIIACFILGTASVYAEPEPFGIKIKETDINDIKSKYKFKDAGVNQYSQGKMIDLEPTQLNFQGLKNIRLIFGEDGKVLAVLTVIDKSRYNDLLDMLSNKYKLISKNGAFVGDMNAEFEDDNTKIFLEAPHLSFNLDLNYIHNNLYQSYIKQSQENKQEKTNQEMGKI
jgi:hypothetical protein